MHHRLLLSIVFFLALAWTPATAAAAAAPGSGADLGSLEDLPPLWEHRAGVSETEPNFCTAEEVRETNPNAANTRSLEAGPPKFLVEDLEPGASYRHCFFILNRYPERRSFELSTVDVGGSLDPDVTLETSDSPSVVGAWIQLPTTTIELDPGERVVLPYRLEVPAQPPVGTSVGGIRIVDVTERGAGGAQLRRALVLQLQTTFPGGSARDLDISSVRAPKLIWRGRDAPRYRLRFVAANRGTVVDAITPSLRVGGLFGRTVATVTGTPDVVVPGSAQRLALEWNDVPWIGRYTPVLRVKSETGTRDVELPTLWVIPPWPYLLGLLVALLLGGYALWRRRTADWREYLDEEELEGDPYDEGHTG